MVKNRLVMVSQAGSSCIAEIMTQKPSRSWNELVRQSKTDAAPLKTPNPHSFPHPNLNSFLNNSNFVHPRAFTAHSAGRAAPEAAPSRPREAEGRLLAEVDSTASLTRDLG